MKPISAVGFAVFLWAGVAIADQSDPRLPELLAQLQDSPNALEAAELEQRIWAAWFVYDGEAVEVTIALAQGNLAMESRRPDLALPHFDRVVALAPDFAEGWNRRAFAYFLLGDMPASVADIEQTLRLEPRHFGALAGLGNIMEQLGEIDRAIAAYERGLVIHPHMAGVAERLEMLRAQRRAREI